MIKKKIVLSPEFIPVFSGVRVIRFLILMWMFCRSFCPSVLFHLAIVLSVLLRFTDSAYRLVSLNTAFNDRQSPALSLLELNPRVMFDVKETTVTVSTLFMVYHCLVE